MNIVVFGAAGGTGLQIVRQALNGGHRVTAFVRRPDALPIRHDNLVIAIGDTTGDESSVAQAIRGQDVVVSALGRRKSLRSDHLIARSMQSIVVSMQQAGVQRLILVSAFGVGASHRDAPVIPRIMYSLLLRDLFADKQVAEDIVRRSNLDWTIVHPVLLTDGPLTTKYRTGERLALRGLPKISRADVAHFILAEIDRRAFVGKVAVVSY